MGRRLLISNTSASALDWLQGQGSAKPLILLDLKSSSFGEPTAARLLVEGKSVGWHFVGTLEAIKAPHLLLVALARFSAIAPESDVVLPSMSGSPLGHQVLRQAASMVQPVSILVEDSKLAETRGWPVGPEVLEGSAAVPALVYVAQRRARWLKLIEESVAHEISLDEVSIEGARLGAGRPVLENVLRSSGLNILYAEAAGNTLLAISPEPIEEHLLSRLLDLTHCTKAVVLKPSDYQDLVCALCRQSGEEFAFGVVREIDFERRTIRVQSNAVPPAPVRVVKLGMLRVDSSGKEEAEIKPWQV